MAKGARFNLRKTQSPIYRKYLSDGVESNWQIWHRHYCHNRPILVSGLSRTGEDPNPSRSSLDLNTLMIWWEERGGIAGECGDGCSSLGGGGGGVVMQSGWMIYNRLEFLGDGDLGGPAMVSTLRR